MFSCLNRSHVSAELARVLTFQERAADGVNSRRISSESHLQVCCICLDPIAAGEASIFVARCSHYFHYNCIKKAFRSQKDASCPLCRRKFHRDPFNETGMTPPCSPAHMKFGCESAFLILPRKDTPQGYCWSSL